MGKGPQKREYGNRNREKRIGKREQRKWNKESGIWKGYKIIEKKENGIKEREQLNWIRKYGKQKIKNYIL